MDPERLHVLLVGIDAYDGGGSLRGCVNDVDAIQGILLDRLGVPAERITRLVSPRSGVTHDNRIPGRPATLAAITAELDRLAGDAVSPGDRVFIHWSGHGTRLVLEDDEGHRFAREALLPKDRRAGRELRFLADWQLNAALRRIAARCQSVTVVLDCCAAAGATREAEAGEAVRRDETTGTVWEDDAGEAVRPDETTGTARKDDAGQAVRVGRTEAVRFLPTDEIVPLPRTADTGTARGLTARVGDVQIVAACRADQRATEGASAGPVMGHLTRAILDQLRDLDPAVLERLRWGDIWRQVEAAVQDLDPRQWPWLSGGFGRAVFGGDPGGHGDIGFAVRPLGDERFELNAGTLAGVSEGARIAVYGPDPATFPPLGSREHIVGELLVVSAEPARCTTTPLAPLSLPAAARGRLVAPGTEARLTVALLNPVPRSDSSVLPGFDGTSFAGPVLAELRASPFLRVADRRQRADVEVSLQGEHWIVTDGVHPGLPAVPYRNAGELCALLEHYHHYSAPFRLARGCRDLPGLLRISVLDCPRPLDPAVAQSAALPEVGGTDRHRYQVTAGTGVVLAVHNDSGFGLHVTLLDAAASGRVAVLGTAHLPPRARERFWLGDLLGRPFQANLPSGVPLGVDRLVAVGTTAPGVDLGHLRLTTGFAEAVRGMSRGRAPAPDAAPVERYTSTTTDLWITS
ncbi:caspase family protein [Actinoplanes sp. G11-F43]|uniref:caspase family protein n=1 Tax=Actinoplanes sp. G11-F43 TaxID=3424130 RepID=UPI003D335C6E